MTTTKTEQMAKAESLRAKLISLIKGKRPFPGRLLLALFPSLGIGFTLFFFGPLDLCYLSRNYISYSPMNIFPITGMIMAAVTLGLLLAASVPGGKIHAFLVSTYTGLLLAFYIQGAFLNLDFGALDGHAVNWPSFSTAMMVNAAVWFLILLVPHLLHYLNRRVWRTFVMLASGVLVLMQAVSLGVKLADQIYYDKQQPGNYYISTENMMKIGQQKNVAVFLLDTVSNAEVDAMLEKYPEALNLFHDFTRFDNANSHYMFTVPSLVSILTGADTWDCENVTIGDYMNNAWKSDTAVYAYEELAAKGYERNLYALKSELVRDPSAMKDLISNVMFSTEDYAIDYKGLLKLAKLSFYRYFPLMMKPFFVIYTTEISNLVHRKDALSSEWDFVERMHDTALSAGDARNVFSFYYLAGTHLPYRMDERGNMVNTNLASDYNVNFTDVEDQLAGFFHLIEDYLRELKALGLYDQTGVIIMSDHGNNQEREADHQPIYFIRMPGEYHDALQINPAPITTQDSFLPDVLSMIGSDPAPLGGILSAEVPDEPVERWTRVYAKDENYPLIKSRFNVMREYKYEGNGGLLRDRWTAGVFETYPMIDCYY